MSSILYNVYDIKEDKQIMTKADSDSIERKIGLQKYKVSEYALNQRQYLHRFCIIKVYEPEDKFKHSDTPEDIIVKKKFDRAMRSLKKNYPAERLRCIVFVRENRERRAV